MKLLMPAALLIGSTLIAAALYVGPGGSSLQHKVSNNLCKDLSKRAAYEASKIATILKRTGVWDEPARRRVLLDYIREKQTTAAQPTMADLNWLLESPFENKRGWDKAFEIKSDEIANKMTLLSREKPFDKTVLENLKEIGIVRSYYCK